ncbi:hypothetical protein ANMWB30_23210 [Arthrobacter sp. MWB30]|nr:hypothetical protein ANMWB30_23210 [Arthrobacter sp. MWB30]
MTASYILLAMERTGPMSRNITSRPGATKAATPASSFATSPGLGERVFLRFGRVGSGVLYRLLAVVLAIVVMLLDYLLVMFTAVSVVPNIAVLIQQGTGVTIDARIDAVIAGWLLPVVFIIAAVLIGEVFLMRKLWRIRGRVLHTVGSSLFRLRDEAGNPVGNAAKASPKARATRVAVTP